MKLAALLCILVVAGGCRRDRDAPGGATLGHERNDCRADKTCDPGLVCLSNLCVRPPPADCKAVAEQLASLELGNYAPPEQRAPAVAKNLADCEKAMVSKDEAKCLDGARDPWSAGQCVPRMFPEMASADTRDCAAIVTKTKALIEKQASYVNDPQMKTWFERTMVVMQQSCEEDRWPDALKKCMLASNTADANMAQCNQQMPPALQQKLQDRLVKAMQDVQPH